MRRLSLILTAFTIFAAAGPALAVQNNTQAAQCLNADNTIERYQQVLACNALLKVNPDNAEALAARGAVRSATGEFPLAIIDLTRAVALKPDSADLLFTRGDTFRRMGRLDDALLDLVKATEIDPTSPRPYAARAAIFIEKGNFVEARDELDKALAIDAHYAPALESRVLLGMKTGNFRISIESADVLASQNPGSAEYQHLKCWTRVVPAAQLDIARKACDQAIALGGGVSSLNSRGLLNLKERKYAAAFADYEAVLATKDNANNADGLLGRGLAFRGLKRKAAARVSIAAALAVEPGIADMFRRYGYAP